MFGYIFYQCLKCEHNCDQERHVGEFNGHIGVNEKKNKFTRSRSEIGLTARVTCHGVSRRFGKFKLNRLGRTQTGIFFFFSGSRRCLQGYILSTVRLTREAFAASHFSADGALT